MLTILLGCLDEGFPLPLKSNINALCLVFVIRQWQTTGATEFPAECYVAFAAPRKLNLPCAEESTFVILLNGILS